ncbi:MAG: tetratricopeptide repeat protein [bacterium]
MTYPVAIRIDSGKKSAILIFLLGLLVHAFFLWNGRGDPTFLRPSLDSQTYHDFACQLIAGSQSDTPFYQPPFFPYLLAGICLVFGTGIMAAKIVLAIMGSLISLFAYLIAGRLFNHKVAVLAGILTVLYGPLLFLDTQLLPVGIATLLNTALLWLLLRARPTSSFAEWLPAGLCLGLAAITIPNALLFLAVVPLWLYFAADRKFFLRRVLLPSMNVLAGAACIIAPVTLYNYSVTQRFILISHNGGINFYIGNNLNTDKTIAIRPGFDWQNLDRMSRQAGGRGPADYDRFFYREAGNYIRQNPGHFIRHFIGKIRQVTNARELPRNMDIYVHRDYNAMLRVLVWQAGSFGFPFGVVFPLACWGMVAGLRRNRDSLLPALFVSAYAFSVALVFVASRYRVVFAPALCIFAAYALCWLQEQWPWHRQRALAAALITIVIAGIWTNTPCGAFTDRIPFKAEMFNFLALQSIRSKNYDQADRELRDSLASAPDYVATYMSLGYLKFEQGDLQGALTAYKKAAQIDPRCTETYYRLGGMYERLGQPANAEQAYRQALELSPGTARIYMNLGMLLYNAGRSQEAAPLLEQSICLDPSDNKAYALLAWILATSTNDALRNGKRAVELALHPVQGKGQNDPMREDTLAAAYAEDGSFQLAIQAAERAVRSWNADGNNDFSKQSRNRLDLYKKSRPYRE